MKMTVTKILYSILWGHVYVCVRFAPCAEPVFCLFLSVGYTHSVYVVGASEKIMILISLVNRDND